MPRMIAAQVLVTLVTLGFSAAPAFADFNKTHATNPSWTPHARFHVVWQVSSYLGIGAISLALIWWPGPLAIERLWLATGLAVAVYGGFFAALFTMKSYGGMNYDENGYPPVYKTILRKRVGFDANITVFTIMALVTLGAVATIPVR